MKRQRQRDAGADGHQGSVANQCGTCGGKRGGLGGSVTRQMLFDERVIDGDRIGERAERHPSRQVSNL